MMSKPAYVAVTALLVLFVPTAGAQQMMVNLDIEEAPPLVPGGPSASMKVTAQIEMPNNVAWPVARVGGETIPVTIVPVCAPGFAITGPAQIEVPIDLLATGTQSRASASADFQASASKDAEGLRFKPCSLKATTPDSPEGGYWYVGAVTTQELAVRAEYRGALVTNGPAVAQSGPDGPVVALPVVCDCNAETTVLAEVVDPPTGVNVWVDTVSIAAFEDEAQMLQLSFSGAAGREVVVRLTPTATDAPEQEGDSVEVRVAIPGEAGLPAPSPVAPLIFVLLMGLAIARRGAL